MTNAEAIVQIYNKLLERETDIKPDTTVMALGMVAYAAELIRGELNSIEGTLAQTKKSCVISYGANNNGAISDLVPPAEYNDAKNSGGTVFLETGAIQIPAQFIIKYDEGGAPKETYIFGMLTSLHNEMIAVVLKERTGVLKLDGYEFRIGGNGNLFISGATGELSVEVRPFEGTEVNAEVWEQLNREKRIMNLTFDGEVLGVFSSGGNPACAPYIDSQNRLSQVIFTYDQNADRYYAQKYILTATQA